MSIIYLDYNCYQRNFDDFSQLRIKMEALACQWIFTQAEKDNLQLVWSFMHYDENHLCPFFDRKVEVLRLSKLSKVEIGIEDKIYEDAKTFQKKEFLSSKDAIHLACAYFVKSDFFLTCDDRFKNQAKRLNLDIAIMNPVSFVIEG
jgi:PIN domain